jgi:hypothetical protein
LPGGGAEDGRGRDPWRGRTCACVCVRDCMKAEVLTLCRVFALRRPSQHLHRHHRTPGSLRASAEHQPPFGGGQKDVDVTSPDDDTSATTPQSERSVGAHERSMRSASPRGTRWRRTMGARAAIAAATPRSRCWAGSAAEAGWFAARALRPQRPEDPRQELPSTCRSKPHTSVRTSVMAKTVSKTPNQFIVRPRHGRCVRVCASTASTTSCSNLDLPLCPRP